MEILEKIKGKLTAEYSDWIKVEDDTCRWTIEDFSYETGVIDEAVKPSCWRCVTVNKCLFANVEGKKPKTYVEDKTLFEKIEQGSLYHPNCHCKEYGRETPMSSNIDFIFLQGKVNYFFKDKLKWYYAWGYEDEDKEKFTETIKRLVKDSYIKGNYECEKHTKYGFSINVFINIPGIKSKQGRSYGVWSCYMVFPDGKLKLNTLIGGRE